MIILNFIRGFCMALADSVPGGSGGTIAFILGFYDDFINSLNTLVSKAPWEEKKKALIFLIKLGFGWVVGLGLSVVFLSSIFNDHIYAISSLFTGLIIVAIPMIIKQEKDSIIGQYKNIIFTIIGITIVALITYFNPAAGSEGLPGISGSTLLLIFGLYTGIINAIKEFLTFNFEYVPVLVIFGLGVITGIVSTIKIIKIELKRHRSQMIYLILGLMIGSLYAVFMGPTTLEVAKPAMNLSTFNFVYFIIGGAILLGLEKGKDLLEKRAK